MESYEIESKSRVRVGSTTRGHWTHNGNAKVVLTSYFLLDNGLCLLKSRCGDSGSWLSDDLSSHFLCCENSSLSVFQIDLFFTPKKLINYLLITIQINIFTLVLRTIVLWCWRRITVYSGCRENLVPINPLKDLFSFDSKLANAFLWN